MKDEEINRLIAEACGHDLWVIKKRGLYYRPDAHGYTSSIAEAWKLPKEEAKHYEMYADRTDIDQCEKVLIEPAPLPRYTEDFNAIEQAKATLSEAQLLDYFRILEIRVDQDSGGRVIAFAIGRATARQCAETLARIFRK